MNQETKQLLENAAKACGYSVDGVDEADNFLWVTKGVRVVKWNPLTSGDDLSDAIAGRLSIISCARYVMAREAVTADLYAREDYAAHNGDKSAAMAMACLRVLAMMGEEM